MRPLCAPYAPFTCPYASLRTPYVPLCTPYMPLCTPYMPLTRPCNAGPCQDSDWLSPYVHVCACVYGQPSTRPHTLHPPQGGNTQNSEISVCLELIQIRATDSPYHWKLISPELIQIIQFSWKILYLWILLNSCRLTLITPDTSHLPAMPLGAEEPQILKTQLNMNKSR